MSHYNAMKNRMMRSHCAPERLVANPYLHCARCRNIYIYIYRHTHAHAHTHTKKTSGDNRKLNVYLNNKENIRR